MARQQRLNTYKHILSPGTIELENDKHKYDSFPRFLAVAFILSFATANWVSFILGHSCCKAANHSPNLFVAPLQNSFTWLKIVESGMNNIIRIQCCLHSGNPLSPRIQREPKIMYPR